MSSKKFFLGIFLFSCLIVPLKSFAEIRIGLAVPLTGDYAEYGEQIKYAAEFAVRKINDSEGTSRNRIELIVEDDSGSPTQAVSVAHRFAAMEIKYVVGHFTSGCSIAASEVYRAYNILQITPSSQNPKLTERGLSNIFRIAPSYDSQFEILSLYLDNLEGDKQFAIYTDKDSRNEIESGINKYYQFGNSFDGFHSLGSDYNLSQNSRTNVHIFYSYNDYNISIINNIVESRTNNIFCFMDINNPVSFLEQVYLNNNKIYLLQFPDPTISFFSTSAFREIESNIPEDKIGTFSAYAYDSISVLHQAFKNVGSDDVNRVIGHMKSATFQSTFGPIQFKGNGDVKGIDYRFIFKQGENDYVLFNHRPPPP